MVHGGTDVVGAHEQGVELLLFIRTNNGGKGEGEGDQYEVIRRVRNDFKKSKSRGCHGAMADGSFMAQQILKSQCGADRDYKIKVYPGTRYLGACLLWVTYSLPQYNIVANLHNEEPQKIDKASHS